MVGKLVPVTGAIVLLLAGAAHAQTTYCVEAPDCIGSPATLDDALAAADADRVEVGPGIYDGPFVADADHAVDVVGAGRGATVLTAAGPAGTVISLAAPGSAVRGLTVRLGAAADMTGVSAASATDVAIEGAGTGATGFAGQSLTRAVVDLGAGATGVRLSGSGALLDNVRIRASGIGVQFASDTSATLRHVTLAGDGAGTGLDVVTGSAATLSSSLITGFATPIRTDAQCLAPCVATDHSAYDPELVAGVVTPATTPVREADLRLGDDLRPRFDSPLVDAASPATGGGTDATGFTRVVDGDGDGDGVSDIGALEYQRRAPVISGAAASPATALAGAPIAFSATASDPDGEAVSATWTFSDGATATGLDAAHAFAAPGPASAELRVTDDAGVAATTSVPVTIQAAPAGAAPAGVAPAGADPPATVTRRSVIARVLPDAVRLRAVPRRDRRAPYRFRLRGRVVLPEGISTAGCQGGAVQLAIRAGERRLTRSPELAADCSFRATLKLGRKRARRVVVRPRFGGTAALAPLDGAKLRLRAG